MGRVLLSDALGPLFGEGTALHSTLAELVYAFPDRPTGRVSWRRVCNWGSGAKAVRSLFMRAGVFL